MAAQSVTIVIDEIEIPVIFYRDKPVLTTEYLARLYGTETANVRMNFKNNADRFEAGKHFFKVTGEALQELKNRVNGVYSVKIAHNVNAITLWTERGAARHAKMLDTDKAWDVFEKLEACYFEGVKPQGPGPILHTAEERITYTQLAELKQLVWTMGNCYHMPGGGEWAGYALVRENFGVQNTHQLPARHYDEALALLQWAERMSREFKSRVIAIERKFLKNRFRICPPELDQLANEPPDLLLNP